MMTPEEKAERARQRMIQKAREYSTRTYSARYVSSVFQRMIRAEAAALPEGLTPAVVDGKMHHVGRFVGQCVCVTCGRVTPWTNSVMQTGHFLPSRCFSILYEEGDQGNVAPQCIRCNKYEHGAPDRFRLWMASVRGEETIERLEKLKATTRQFSRDELVDMKIGYSARLKAAEQRMQS